MKKIMIDMDEVICGKGFLRLVNNFLNTNYKEEDIKGYYIQDLIQKKEEKSIEITFAIKIYMNMQNYYQVCVK